MGKRYYNFKVRHKAKATASNRKVVRITEQVIKTVEKVEEGGVEKIKITTPNGIRWTFSQDDNVYRHLSEKWMILRNCLMIGDKVEVYKEAGKVFDCKINWNGECHIILDFQQSRGEIILTFREEGTETKIKIRKEDIEENKVICEDMVQFRPSWNQICAAKEKVVGKIVRTFVISDRLVFIHFGQTLY